MNGRRKFLLWLLQLPFIGLFSKVVPASAREREVLLNQFSVAGFRYYQGPVVLKQLRAGAKVRLLAEPNNPHDPFAVRIFWGEHKIGYVPRSDNKHISRLLRKGVRLNSRILEVHPEAEPWQQVRVGVYLPLGQ